MTCPPSRDTCLAKRLEFLPTNLGVSHCCPRLVPNNQQSPNRCLVTTCLIIGRYGQHITPTPQSAALYRYASKGSKSGLSVPSERRNASGISSCSRKNPPPQNQKYAPDWLARPNNGHVTAITEKHYCTIDSHGDVSLTSWLPRNVSRKFSRKFPNDRQIDICNTDRTQRHVAVGTRRHRQAPHRRCTAAREAPASGMEEQRNKSQHQ